MLAPAYQKKLTTMIREFLPDHKIFLFGSSLENTHFQDIDVGILGDVTPETLRNLKDHLYKSTFPFIVDLVDFNQVSDNFKDHVLNTQPKQWL